MENETYEVAIIGGGAAGLSAALVLGRARRRVVVIDAGSPRNAPAEHMHGFLSRDGMPPSELISAAREEVRRYGVEILDDRVEAAELGFSLRLATGRTVAARHILLTTGATDELPDIAGARERWGRDFLHCPYCHGWEVRDQSLGVLATGPGSVVYAHLLRQWSDDVILFTHTYAITDDDRVALDLRGIGIVDGPVQGLVVDDDRLQAVELTDGRAVPRAALFIRPALRAHAGGPAAALGCELEADGLVRSDADGRTSVPGVWVAGNATNPRAQVITAAGEGSAVAIAINTELVADAVDRAAALSSPLAHSERPGGLPMTSTENNTPGKISPPTSHQLALMIWLCVFPTLTALNLALGSQLASLSPVPRTFVLATIAVPIVIYGLMPHFHRVRARLLSRA